MKTKYILKGLLATLVMLLVFSGCESYNEAVVDDIGASREFSPIGLTTRIRNQTTVELNWTVKDEEVANYYVVEFSADDPDFKTIYKTVKVAPKELPIQVQLEGETVYSIRVKAVSATGLEDSKWSVTTATTLTEQLYLASVDGDIDAKQVTLRWPANSNVTQIVLSPGNITHTITSEEKANGIAVITGLTSETAYTATLFNGTKKRGDKAFTTGIDIGTGILVRSTDDLMQKIADAASGSVLVLEPGDYLADNQIGAITLNKSITLRGLRSFDRPKLHVNFALSNGAANLSLIDLDLKGDKGSGGVSVIKFNDNNVTYGSVLISGCNIHDYGVSLISANLSAARITSIIVDNTVVTNVLTVGGEFIDLRGSYLGQLTLKNSTFNNCATARYFIRMDAGLTGVTNNILIDSCTISNPNMVATNANSILYIRFASNAIIIKNTLFANTLAPYTRENVTANPTFSGNNYFNTPNLNGNVNAIGNNRPDATGTALNPQFGNAAGGDFTINNQTLKDNGVGDPRWIK
ncbi:hypothetical protein FLA105534_03203 [Flavobacterium bizetiae]|uniref:Fibronectin type-III domain-containing protein n=1 Tax=Flavobacterium bizetiae TaxID=2704140 RepID=A0A6J4GRP3_9FLAO|nr:DUF4957 domain-containing protein [Flavobacterium bizetiae]CAA9200707.1 hypothetical protein FLA105534_03203 [Flavobacterium bizetiae]CAD5342021.1 hypothetical protein FLA105535_02000 [Flavobacterium bizetiae]CAD5348287.1 hypothetical protein FLA105534_02248 [Flavobacterium bizetiae]